MSVYVFVESWLYCVSYSFTSFHIEVKMALRSCANPQDFPRVAKEMGFVFCLRRGRVDWHKIDNINVDKLIQDCDLVTLQDNLINVINYKLDNEYDVKILDPNFVKLFKLAQLSVEYLMYSEQHIYNCVELAQSQLNTLLKVVVKLKKLCKKKDEDLKKITRKLKEVKRMVEIQGQQLQFGSTGAGLIQCRVCSKMFLNGAFLETHMTHRHPDQPLQFPDMHVAHKQPDQPLPVEVSDRHRRETERLQLEIKELKERLNSTERILQQDGHKAATDALNQQLLTSMSNVVGNDEIWKSLRKQDEEMQLLRERFNGQVTSNMKDVQLQLEMQDEQWRTKLQQLGTQHRTDLEELHNQLVTQTKSNYEGKISELNELLRQQGEQIRELNQLKVDLAEHTPPRQHTSTRERRRREMKLSVETVSSCDSSPAPRQALLREIYARHASQTKHVKASWPDASSVNSSPGPRGDVVPFQETSAPSPKPVRVAAQQPMLSVETKTERLPVPRLEPAGVTTVIPEEITSGGDSSPSSKHEPLKVPAPRHMFLEEVVSSGESSLGSEQEPVKAATPKQEPVKAVKSKQEPVKVVTSKQEPGKVVTSKQEPVKAVTSKQEPVKVVTSKQEPVKAVTSKQELVKAVTSKQEPVKAVTSEQEPVKAVTSNLEPVKAFTSKQEPVKVVTSKQEMFPQEVVSSAESSPNLPAKRISRKPLVPSVQTSRDSGLDSPKRLLQHTTPTRVVTPHGPVLQDSGSSEGEDTSQGEEETSESGSDYATESEDEKQNMAALSSNFGTNTTDVRAEVQEDLERRLRELGVDPEWKGIPQATFEQKMTTLQHHQNITSKRYRTYFKMRKSLLNDLEDRLERQTSQSELNQEEPAVASTSLDRLMGRVKDKALQVLKLSDSSRNASGKSLMKGSTSASSITRSQSEASLWGSDGMQSQNYTLSSSDSKLPSWKQPGGQARITASQATPTKPVPELRRTAADPPTRASLPAVRPTTANVVVTKPQFHASLQAARTTRMVTSTPVKQETSASILKRPSKDVELSTVRRQASSSSSGDDMVQPRLAGSRLQMDWRSSGDDLSLKSPGKAAQPKKKVLFVDQGQPIRNQGTGAVVSLSQPSDKFSSANNKPSAHQESESDWEISSDPDDGDPKPMMREPSSEPTIRLSTKQSDKIAQLSSSISRQMAVARSKPTGGVDTMFPGTQQADNAPGGGNSKLPVPQPRQARSSLSDWDLEDFDDIAKN